MSNPQLVTELTFPGDTPAINNVPFPFGFSPLNELRVSAPSAVWVVSLLPMRQGAGFQLEQAP